MSEEVEDVIYDTLSIIVDAYKELSSIMKSKLSDRIISEVMSEVARISINELARQLILSTYPEVDDLPEREYLIIDTLVPAFLEKYVLEKLSYGSRSISEIIDELVSVVEGLRVNEDVIKSMYDKFIKYVREGKLKEFIFNAPKDLLKEGKESSN